MSQTKEKRKPVSSLGKRPRATKQTKQVLDKVQKPNPPQQSKTDTAMGYMKRE